MIKPIGKYILVTKIIKEKSDGGIILTDGIDKYDSVLEGKIEAVGDEVFIDEFDAEDEEDIVSIGSKILFDAQEAYQKEYEGTQYFIIREKAILALI